MAIKAILNKIIVEPVEAETKTASGIIIPDSAQEKPNRGKVNRNDYNDSLFLAGLSVNAPAAAVGSAENRRAICVI